MMRLKKRFAVVLIIVILFCLGKTSLLLSAAENSGYIVLINDDNSPISFAGIQYSLSDDLKNLSIEFQITDIHTYRGQQGIRFSIICGNEKDEIFIDSDSFTRTESSLFSLKNTVNKIDVFNSHSNIRMAFELSFSKKITDNLILEAAFIDASGIYTEKTSCVLYSTQETSKSSTESKESTTTKEENNSYEKEITTEKDSVASSKSPQYSSDKYNNKNSYNSMLPSQNSGETYVTDLNDTEKADSYNNRSSVLGIQQIVAIILAVFLFAAAFVCIILGIKKSKVN